MKTYKEYPTAFLGCSDVASLVVRDSGSAKLLSFGEDGGYRARIVDSGCEIPEHYSLVMECDWWIRVYDDTGRTLGIYAGNRGKIRIYRAGLFGCIIEIPEGSEIQQMTTEPQND